MLIGHSVGRTRNRGELFKAAECDEYCTPSELVYDDTPSPTPGRGQVVTTMAASGGNFADSLIVQHSYRFKLEVPCSPGLRGAGIIRELGGRIV